MRRRKTRAPQKTGERNMSMARSFNNWIKYRQTVSELGRMNARELSDLGINRDDIRRVARKAAF
ncbi:hypothetical protein AZF01_11965 [Martelella sp. AD-3]|nr:hypothetical protein AZF01_11965 [Martelella sp. AD-3]